ncbi:hypothetical protein [Chryseobacterium sp.]|uniref:hypothetical protein n=1 Tax=Chryseobacterium sp. TaxID=1871047 RepID=UPI0011C94E3A|nr:hypothetical protein [Chryseobacterium sp.]TXF77661.1 hypothetical protein FUA25_06965 [Chryseobacterium sp.]
MENLQNNTPESGNTPKRNQYISADELINRMKVAFSNAQEPEIQSQLETVGITKAKLESYLQEIEQLEQLSNTQRQAYGEQYAETDRFNNKLAEIDLLYTRHRNLCKIAMKGNRQAYATLGIDKGRKRAFSAWYQQVSNFYAQLLANDDFKAKAAEVNINNADITAQQNALQEISTLKQSQKKELGEAQKATEIRDEALDLLYPKYSELTAYAKVLFPNDQTLEKLGIIVR